jgi:nicotinate-nucleotide adenylyltransferase
VWWLVSPQNPLKSASGMALLAERLRQAAGVAAASRKIRVTGIETTLGTTYTADTIRRLRRRFPGIRFVWLMGGDNLAQFPYWKHWQEIFRTVPIAVFDRPATSLKALAGKAAHRFARARIVGRRARRLAEMNPPAWTFFYTRLDPRSATRIRAGRVLQRPQENQPDVTLEANAVTQTASIATLRPRPRRVFAPAELLHRIVDTLEDGKAEDIVTLDLAGKTTIADYMVVASGRSARQVAALTEHLETALADGPRLAVEGKAQGDWVLVDAGDVIVHLFRPDIRSYYNLEKMWGDDTPRIEAAQT